MKRILLAAILFLAAFNLSAPAKTIKHNLEILDEGISGEFEKILYSPGIDRNNTFCFYVNGYDGYFIKRESPGFDTGILYTVSVLRKTAEKLKLRFSIAKGLKEFESDTSFYKLRITDNQISVAYPKFIKNKFLGEKSIERRITASLDAEIQTRGIIESRREEIRFNYKDEIDYDEKDNLESDDYPFTKAKAPEVSSFESVLFPVLLVGVSAAATFLFFLIRTK